jgi:hypothetical protein
MTKGEIHFFSTAGISFLISFGLVLFLIGIIMIVFAIVQNFRDSSLFEVTPYYRDFVIMWSIISSVGFGISVFSIIYFL